MKDLYFYELVFFCLSNLLAACTSMTPLATLLAAPANPPTIKPPAATLLARRTLPPLTKAYKLIQSIELHFICVLTATGADTAPTVAFLNPPIKLGFSSLNKVFLVSAAFAISTSVSVCRRR